MNHRRAHLRHDPETGRERSSTWRYPQVERGSGKRSRAGNRRRAQSARAMLDAAVIEDQDTAMPQRHGAP